MFNKEGKKMEFGNLTMWIVIGLFIAIPAFAIFSKWFFPDMNYIYPYSAEIIPALVGIGTGAFVKEQSFHKSKTPYIIGLLIVVLFLFAFQCGSYGAAIFEYSIVFIVAVKFLK